MCGQTCKKTFWKKGGAASTVCSGVPVFSPAGLGRLLEKVRSPGSPCGPVQCGRFPTRLRGRSGSSASPAAQHGGVPPSPALPQGPGARRSPAQALLQDLRVAASSTGQAGLAAFACRASADPPGSRLSAELGSGVQGCLLTQPRGASPRSRSFPIRGLPWVHQPSLGSGPGDLRLDTLQRGLWEWGEERGHWHPPLSFCPTAEAPRQEFPVGLIRLHTPGQEAL